MAGIHKPCVKLRGFSWIFGKSYRVECDFLYPVSKVFGERYEVAFLAALFALVLPRLRVKIEVGFCAAAVLITAVKKAVSDKFFSAFSELNAFSRQIFFNGNSL